MEVEHVNVPAMSAASYARDARYQADRAAREARAARRWALVTAVLCGLAALFMMLAVAWVVFFA